MLALPVLIFVGLPATVANGTNRVAILVQNLGAVWSFHRHGMVEWRWLRAAAAPAIAGALVGTGIAVVIADETLQTALAILMLVIAAWTIWDPLKHRPVGDTLDLERYPLGPWGLAVAFFLVGLYGGFIQVGVGFLVLAVTTSGGMNLVRGNALKVLVVLVFTVPALTLFAAGGKVRWGLGAALAAGNLLGGLAGVKLNVLKGHRWVRRVVTIMVVAFALRLLID